MKQIGKVMVLILTVCMVFNTIVYAEADVQIERSNDVNDFLKRAVCVEKDNSFIFTEKIEISVNSTRSSEIKHYRQDTMVLYAEDVEKAKEIRDDLKRLKENDSLERSGGSNNKYAWDESGQVRAFSTVYYDLSYIGSSEYIKMTKISGGFESGVGSGASVGSGVSVTNQYIDVGQNGKSANGFEVNQTRFGVTFNNSQRNWTYTPPASWTPVDTQLAFTVVGVNYYVILKRGTSSATWKIHVQNLVADTGSISPVG